MWLVRALLSLLTALGSLVLLVPSGCNDLGGVPSWERCTSFLGLPTPLLGEMLGLGSFWDVILPLVVATSLGILVWIVLGNTILGGTGHSDE